MACSLSLVPLASFACWRGRSTVGPSGLKGTKPNPPAGRCFLMLIAWANLSYFSATAACSLAHARGSVGKDLHPGPSAWPGGGGELGARARAFDWAKTPLGPVSGWAHSLRTTIDLMLASHLAVTLISGPGRIL